MSVSNAVWRPRRTFSKWRNYATIHGTVHLEGQFKWKCTKFGSIHFEEKQQALAPFPSFLIECALLHVLHSADVFADQRASFVQGLSVVA